MAVSQLDDRQLDLLLSAAVAEQRRREKKSTELAQYDRKQHIEAVTASLNHGKIKAIRAAFKAGVAASQIARHFGVSQADVRKALRSDALKR